MHQGLNHFGFRDRWSPCPSFFIHPAWNRAPGMSVGIPRPARHGPSQSLPGRTALNGSVHAHTREEKAGAVGG